MALVLEGLAVLGGGGGLLVGVRRGLGGHRVLEQLGPAFLLAVKVGALIPLCI